jgi:putative redox protein
MTNKSKELKVELSLKNDKLHFHGHADNNTPISIDYIPPYGDNLGYTSLELFLLSLSSCIASSLLIFLRTFNKTVISLQAQVKGIRNEEHPTGFTTIHIDFQIHSKDVKAEDIDKALKMSEDQYCPVWTMLDKSLKVNVNYNIID